MAAAKYFSVGHRNGNSCVSLNNITIFKDKITCCLPTVTNSKEKIQHLEFELRG